MAKAFRLRSEINSLINVNILWQCILKIKEILSCQNSCLFKFERLKKENAKKLQRVLWNLPSTEITVGFGGNY